MLPDLAVRIRDSGCRKEGRGRGWELVYGYLHKQDSQYHESQVGGGWVVKEKRSCGYASQSQDQGEARKVAH